METDIEEMTANKGKNVNKNVYNNIEELGIFHDYKNKRMKI